MTERGVLNFSSAILIVTSLLMTYFAFSSNHWINSVESSIKDLQAEDRLIEPRITTVESTVKAQFEEVQRRLVSIESLLRHERDR